MPRGKRSEKGITTGKISKIALKKGNGTVKAIQKAKKVVGAKSALSASAVNLPKLSLPKFNLGKIKEARRSRNFYVGLAVVGFALLLLFASKYLIVAWVDNQPITKFQLYSNLEKRFGKDLREQMIVESLIKTEAQKRGVVVNDEEVSAEIQKVEKQQGGADQLKQILQLQGINEAEFRDLVRLQVIKQKMFGASISVAEDEVDKYIEENKQFLVNSNPDNQTSEISEEMKNSIREDLKQQKVNEEFNKWLQETLQGPRVRRV